MRTEEEIRAALALIGSPEGRSSKSAILTWAEMDGAAVAFRWVLGADSPFNEDPAPAERHHADA